VGGRDRRTLRHLPIEAARDRPLNVRPHWQVRVDVETVIADCRFSFIRFPHNKRRK